MTPAWPVEWAAGAAAEFHARSLPDPPARAVWVFRVERPAIVLGSTQEEVVVDADRARRLGVDVVRRRSGGGAVLLVPGESLWVDVVLPRADPWWDDDVHRAAHWVGETWRQGLAALGIDATVHRGRLVRTPWSSLVCFAGLGPGEVTVAGAKVVGISQRRTRDAARFQCVALARWDAAATVDLLAVDDEARADAMIALGRVAIAVPGGATGLARLERAFLAALAAR